jgi:LPXTG-motif cell wall-anchored protein
MADSQEGLTNLDWTDGGTALVENLVVGDYVITETDRGQLALTDIAGGKLTQEEGQVPHNDADLTAGTVTVTVASDDTVQAAVTYTNSMYKTTINILKIDETTRGNAAPTKLGQAKFILKKWNGTSTYEPVGTQTTSDETGTLSFTGLLDGEYKIEEDETPPGYVKVQDNDIYFSIADGVVKRYDKGVDQADRAEIPSQVITNPGNESESETKDVVIANISYTMDFSTHSAQFTVGNTPGARLPSTGGSGTTLYHLFGSLLMLAAAVLLVVKRRMRA